MLKSKSISDFEEARIAALRPDETLPVALHLYFQANDHIMVFLPAGVILSKEQLARYKERGLETVWVHKSDWNAFQNYLMPPLEAPVQQELTALISTDTSVTETTHVKMGEGATIDYSVVKGKEPLPQELIYNSKASAKKFLDIMRDDSRNEREKCALVAKFSRQLLGAMTSPTSLENQESMNRSIAQTVHDLLVETSPHVKNIADPIWAITAIEPDLNHGVNVATLAVLFAMSFGKIDELLIGDIGVAGLLHDTGMAMLPFSLGQTPQEQLQPEQMGDFLLHPSLSAKLVTEYAPEISERVPSLIGLHYGNFSDAKNSFPNKDLAQFIALADDVDALCKGQSDGVERTVLEALFMIEATEIQNDPTRHFNKGVFTAVLRWIRANTPDHSLESASAAISVRQAS